MIYLLDISSLDISAVSPHYIAGERNMGTSKSPHSISIGEKIVPSTV